MLSRVQLFVIPKEGYKVHNCRTVVKVTGRQSPRVSFGILSIIYMTEDGIVVHGFGHAAVRLSRTDERMIGYNYETYACGGFDLRSSGKNGG